MSIRSLTSELAEQARVELNEDPKRIASDIQHIKDWLSKQPHINARTDDQWLIAFLRGCKYSLERAKEKLDLYYSLRTISPEFYEREKNDSVFRELMDLGVYTIMPKTASPGSPRLVIVRPGKYDYEKISLIDLFRMIMTVQKILMIEDDTAVICGLQWLVDLEGISVGFMLQITPSLMKNMSVQIQDAAPLRMKGLHYINCTPAFEKIITLLKFMLNEKNKNRLFVHDKNSDSLYKHIPKSVFPSEYGGSGGSIKEISDTWKTKRQQYQSWLEEDAKYKTDESKRPGKPRTVETLLGIEGSFRQLEFD